MNNTSLLLLGAGILPGLLSAGESTVKAPAVPTMLPPETSRPHFRVSLGAGYRSTGDVRFRSGSRSGGVRLPFLAAATGRGSLEAGAADSYADRSYSDGYVRQDAGTGDDGSTWYWGYEDAAQVSSGTGGGALTFHGGAPSASRSSQGRQDGDPGAWGVEGDGVAPAVQLDWTYDLRPELSLGVSLQYSFLNFDGRQSVSNFTAFQTRSSHSVSVADVYQTGDILVPQAPYSGTAGGPGPLIENLPSARTYVDGPETGRSRVEYFNRIEESLDVSLHQFTLGPTVTTRLGAVQLAAGAGLSLNIADWEATHTETLYVKSGRQNPHVYRRWSDAASGTDILPGVYLQLAATVPLTPRLSLTAYGNHDWSQTLTGRVGPSEFTVDPTGWTLGGMIGYSF